MVSWGDQSRFSRSLATEVAKAANGERLWRSKELQRATDKKVVPGFHELYQGKMQLTFHHGRRYDQDDLRAIDCRAEADRRRQLEAEDSAKGLQTNNEDDADDGRPHFVSHFPKPPGREELDRRVARDQSGLWSLEKPGEPSRVERVIAKKWGVDYDAEYWSDGTLKKPFLRTFFGGRRYDSDDYQRMDKKAEGDLRRALEAEEMVARKKYASGLFPEEIAQIEKEREARSKPKFLMNFPKLDKKQGVAGGPPIKMLDALPPSALAPTTRWKPPEPYDFVCVPSRPGVGLAMATQKNKIARKQREYRERKAQEDEDIAFAETNEGGEEVDFDVPPDRPTTTPSAQTSITIMRSDLSVPMTPSREHP